MRAKFYGPRWFRFGWSEQCTGLGRVVADVFSVVTRRVEVRVEITRRRNA